MCNLMHNGIKCIKCNDVSLQRCFNHLNHLKIQMKLSRVCNPKSCLQYIYIYIYLYIYNIYIYNIYIIYIYIYIHIYSLVCGVIDSICDLKLFKVIHFDVADSLVTIPRSINYGVICCPDL